LIEKKKLFNLHFSLDKKFFIYMVALFRSYCIINCYIVRYFDQIKLYTIVFVHFNQW